MKAKRQVGVNIVKLERLIAVYEAGSFRKAARQLGMSQPALTWGIRQLEESYNVTLFQRGPRGIRATPMCEQLIPRAKLIVSEQNRLIAELERSQRTQVIAVGIHPVMLDAEFARCLAAFRQSHKDIGVRVVEGYSAALIERLRSGELDVAYCARPAGGEDETDFEWEPLVDLTYAIFGRSDHPIFDDIAAGRPIGAYPWAEYDAANIVVREGNRDQLLSILRRNGFDDAAPRVRAPSMGFIKTLITEAGMLGFVADSIMADEVARGRVRPVDGSRVAAPQMGLVTVAGTLEWPGLRRLKSMLRRMKSASAT